MRHLIVVLMLLAVTKVHAQNGDRFWGEFEIARARVVAGPIGGGRGGFGTSWGLIHAQAAVRVEDQHVTWEWLGLTEPGRITAESESYRFEAFSNTTYEFTGLNVDLQPLSSDIWGSTEEMQMPYPQLKVSGGYATSDSSTDFEAVYPLKLRARHLSTWVPVNASDVPIDMYFQTVVSSVDFRAFPNELRATIRADASTEGVSRPEGARFDYTSEPIAIGPDMYLGSAMVHQFRNEQALAVDAEWGLGGGWAAYERTFTLHHTPAGDVNNDGKVDFSDFLILFSSFQVTEAGRWEDGDFNEDGDVDFHDFLSLTANFEREVVAAPEPSGVFLGLLCVIGLNARRRRQWQAACH